jgi:high-affinity K+ transport system ATPase subunit B
MNLPVCLHATIKLIEEKNIMEISNFAIAMISLLIFFGVVIYFGLKHQDNKDK